ncbi:MAG: hypothetical protein ACFB6R_17250 [Alphaproteobacteria bacterium]
MGRLVLFAVGGGSILTGVFILFMPTVFYETVPGLAVMGPFSIHFIRDVGLAFLASGGALLWGGWGRNRTAALCGASWPSLHAVFHLQIWSMRGFPLDTVFAFDLVAVVLPSVAALWAAIRLAERR